MESTKQEEQGIYAATPPATGLLERLFKLRQHGTTVRTELAAGLTTFITMAYIIFVNPNIMADAGIDHGAAFVATCLAAALGCFLMGLYANWPVGLAPGMGLNAFFTYTVVGTMGYSWQIALGAVFISGVMFMLLTFSRVREWLLNSIPRSLRFAMGAGVGLFLGLIGLKTAGIVVASPATLIKLGHLTSPGPLLAALCFLMIAVLEYRRVFGGILISILSVTLVGWALGLVQYGGVFSAPPSLAPTFLAMDIAGAFNVTMISVILAFLFVHMFDTAGTLMGVAQRAHLVKEDGRIENLSKAMKADSASSVFGGMLGVPPVTSYVESAAGVAAGGRTGLTAVVVGVLFVAAMFFAPLAGMIPAFATAGALIYVAMLMMGGMAHIDWDEHTETIPAIVTVIMMPLTFSVADGIALGFITYVAMKVLTGKHREVSASLYALFVIFVAKFIFLDPPGWRMAASGYPPRTCRCPAGLATHSLIRRPFAPCAASSCPRRWRITGNPRHLPRERKKARSTAGQGKGLRESMFRGTHLAAAIGRIAVGRDQQRHMVVIIGGGDAETQHHLVEECRLRQLHAAGAIVVAGAEHQLIDPGTEVLALQHRLVAAAVVVGQGGGDQFQLLAFYPVQLDLDAMAGAAVCGIQYMRGQTSHGLRAPAGGHHSSSCLRSMGIAPGPARRRSLAARQGAACEAI